jgi:hypothetical protein
MYYFVNSEYLKYFHHFSTNYYEKMRMKQKNIIVKDEILGLNAEKESRLGYKDSTF